MGLTGERGAQGEGTAATQHHCQITVDSFVRKHHSPRERMREDRNRDKVGKKEVEDGDRSRSREIKCEYRKRSWHQLLWRLSCLVRHTNKH